MERPAWAPEGVDIERPSAARLYDFALGGSHNFAVDRKLFEQLTAVMPDLRRPERILAHPDVCRLLDFGKPTAVLLVAMLHLLPDVRITLRTREQVVRLFAGFDLVDPGLVWVPQWRPDAPEEVDEHPERSVMVAGVGRKS